jgi:hypothetical protein
MYEVKSNNYSENGRIEILPGSVYIWCLIDIYIENYINWLLAEVYVKENDNFLIMV